MKYTYARTVTVTDDDVYKENVKKLRETFLAKQTHGNCDELRWEVLDFRPPRLDEHFLMDTGRHVHYVSGENSSGWEESCRYIVRLVPEIRRVTFVECEREESRPNHSSGYYLYQSTGDILTRSKSKHPLPDGYWVKPIDIRYS